VVLKGVTISDDVKFDHRSAGEQDNEIGLPGPRLLLDHGCKVRYRSIWIGLVDRLIGAALLR
jgi:hypothetical protein